MEWRNIYRGFCMGVSDLIPGVSGGTIAVVLGIYERLLAAISGFFSREWKKHLGFLIPLAAGVAVALLTLSHVIKYLLEYHYEPTQFFFLGLILSILPMLMKEANVKETFKAGHIVILIVAAALVAVTAFFKPDKAADPITTLTILNTIGLFLAGWMASMAMLLPGISGSFILLIIGVYPTAINALTTLNLPLIAVIGAGVMVGFVVSSKGISYLLAHFKSATFAAIIGLVIGSIAVVFPGIPAGGMSIVSSIITFILGFAIVSYFSKKK
ncbi:DUF368 domain-containing protein [Bacillus pseudomycoides]|uniref:DUF368 domain-containing protein n=1 Tax=Bacillus pseudomycoides TaxID=64104 RepID=UPI000BF1B9D8|nr:DUF368 domain-containing protein [Bacillus pseudomycoides]PEJ30462.1 DUF368 domain-containing protein [Bacillus pseudomycoides]PHA96220.1 DUF368 domain-containing protein [Bacillus pseudomycoides]PHC72941.1 DUF368 domain-containing protein [Bacillus pseudomycoides]